MINPNRFVAELRLTLHSMDDWPAVRSMLTAAGQRSTASGADVELVSANVHPGSGRLRCVFAAVTSAAVEGVLEAANLPPSLLEPLVELPCLDRSEARR